MKAFDYCGEEVHIDGSGRFAFDGNMYDTAKEVREFIDRRLKAKNIQAKRKLKLPVVDHLLREYSVTGVHSTHGNLLISPAFDRYKNVMIFADTYTVRQLLKERIRLKAEMDKLDKQLAPSEIDWRHYQHTNDPVEKQYTDLEALYEKAKKGGEK